MATEKLRAIQAIRPIPGFGYARAPRRSLDDLDGLRTLQRGWELLAARSGSPTQQFIWSEAFAETHHDAGRVRVLAVGSHAEPSALAALLQRPGPHERFEALGVRQLFEPMDLLYADRQAANALAAALLGAGRALWLPRLPADSMMIGALQAAYRRRGLLRIVPISGCPYIELDAQWTEPERRFNAGRRSDLRRALRHAQRLGEVTFEVLVPSLLELPALLEQAWAVEAAGWKGVNGSALARRERLGAFFHRYALAACRKGILRVCFMRIAGRVVAMQLAAECAGRFWLFKVGYDEQFARCSPGNLLMLHTVRHAALRGLDSYELLGTASPWTDAWTPLLRQCVSLRAYPPTVRGFAALSMDAVSFGWRRFKRAA